MSVHRALCIVPWIYFLPILMAFPSSQIDLSSASVIGPGPQPNDDPDIQGKYMKIKLRPAGGPGVPRPPGEGCERPLPQTWLLSYVARCRRRRSKARPKVWRKFLSFLRSGHQRSVKCYRFVTNLIIFHLKHYSSWTRRDRAVQKKQTIANLCPIWNKSSDLTSG